GGALRRATEQLPAWGLEPPETRFTLTVKVDGKPQELSLLVGKPTDEKKKAYYDRRRDLPGVFVLDGAVIERLQQSLLDKTIFSFQPSQVKTLKLTGMPSRKQASTLELERKGAGQWETKSPAGGKVNAEHAEKLGDARDN